MDIRLQEAQRIPNKLDPKRTTPRHIIIKMPKVKEKERILKAAREKEIVIYKGVPIRLISQKKPYKKEGIGKKYSKSGKARTYNLDYSIQQSCHLEWKGR